MKTCKLIVALLFAAECAYAEQITLNPIADTGLFEFAPDNNLGSTGALQIGTNGQGTLGRGIFSFDIAGNIPASSRIDAVSISFTVTGTGGDGGAAIHDLYRVQLDWQEGSGNGGQGSFANDGQTTWDSRFHGSAQWTRPGGSSGTDYASIPSASTLFGGVGSHTFSGSPQLVLDVQNWLDGATGNFGWVLISQDEGTAGSTRRIATRELPESAPQLTIEFTPFRITEVTAAGNSVHLDWQGGSPPFQIEHAPSPDAESWTEIATSSDHSVVVDQPVVDSFFRIREAPAPDNARYTVNWTATWNSETHPTDFPDGASLSPLVGATHDQSFLLWELGEVASASIKEVAELGLDELLRSEIQAAIGSGTVGRLLAGDGLSSPGEPSFAFDVSQSHPLVTLVSKIEPSPDWFIAINGLPLLDNGGWLQSKTVVLLAYDAGTDAGTGYVSEDSATNPPDPIFQFSPLSDTRPLGAFTFKRIE